jgi:hypothetical protein
MCLYYTGEECYEFVQLNLSYLDADKAFSTMFLFGDVKHSDYSTDGQARRRNRRGAEARLSVEDQYLFWLVTFRRFRHDMKHAGQLFGIGETAAERYYVTWCAGIAYFSKRMHPMPTGGQLVDMTPAVVSAKLKLGKGHGVVLADCTETPMENPSVSAEHTAVFSTYKELPTVKHLTACTGSSYLCFVSGSICGGCSDTQGHAITGLPLLLPTPGSTPHSDEQLRVELSDDNGEESKESTDEEDGNVSA